MLARDCFYFYVFLCLLPMYLYIYTSHTCFFFSLSSLLIHKDDNFTSHFHAYFSIIFVSFFSLFLIQICPFSTPLFVFKLVYQ